MTVPIAATSFHGSYAPDDVTFLLQPLSAQHTHTVDDLLEKERLIQSGERHYSEMITPEQPPTAAYLALFHAAVEAYTQRMARDLMHLARRIRAERPGPLTLVSLARAGTPIGILLRRVLREAFVKATGQQSEQPCAPWGSAVRRAASECCLRWKYRQR